MTWARYERQAKETRKAVFPSRPNEQLEHIEFHWECVVVCTGCMYKMDEELTESTGRTIAGNFVILLCVLPGRWSGWSPQ